MKLPCDVYKSASHPEMFLYVARRDGLDRVPESLLKKFGEPELALSLVLTEDRKLAREDSQKVLQNLEDQGYHLQLPPVTVGQLGKME